MYPISVVQKSSDGIFSRKSTSGWKSNLIFAQICSTVNFSEKDMMSNVSIVLQMTPSHNFREK